MIINQFLGIISFILFYCPLVHEVSLLDGNITHVAHMKRKMYQKNTIALPPRVCKDHMRNYFRVTWNKIFSSICIFICLCTMVDFKCMYTLP